MIPGLAIDLIFLVVFWKPIENNRVVELTDKDCVSYNNYNDKPKK